MYRNDNILYKIDITFEMSYEQPYADIDRIGATNNGSNHNTPTPVFFVFFFCFFL